MADYWISYTKYITRARVNVDFSLSPKDFLECEDEDELKDMVKEHIWDNVEYGDVEVDDSESEFDIPDEFIKEWKSLKGL